MNQLREFFKGVETLGVDEAGSPVSREIQQAATFLLLYIASGDGMISADESRVILLGIEREFGLERKRAQELVEQAQTQPQRRSEMEGVVKLINDTFDDMQRLRILAFVWRVIAADGETSTFENHAAVEIRTRLGLSLEQGAHARRLAEEGGDLTIEERVSGVERS